MLLAALLLSFGPPKNIPPCCVGMNILADSAAFRALHEPPVQVDFTPEYGHMESIAGAADFVVPPAHGDHSAVLLFHEWWGLNNQIKMTAEKLHEATGVGVVAIDLYGGKVTDKPDEAGQIMQHVDSDAAAKLVRATVNAMADGSAFGEKIRRIGTLGYCFGGGWSLHTALADNSEVKACVMYYGYPELDPHRLQALKAPLLGFFGNQDKGITPELVGKFMALLKQEGKDFSITSYDAPHAFANPSNPHFNKQATEDSWKKTVAFYKRYL